jgi:phage terminase large subunit
VQAEGVVYEGWDSSLHVIDRREIPAEWPRYWTVDFGYKNPFVWQAWATDNDGRLYRYREIYFTQRLVEDHARKILEVTAGEPKPQAIICDHDAEDRATLERHLRIPTIAAKKSISPGIQAVQVRLQKAGDGKPRIFYLRDSLVEVDKELHAQKFPVCTEQEFEVYVWPQAADGKPIKEVPVDLHNHGMDATRYMVAQFDLRRKRPEMQVVDYINGNPRREYD